MLSLAVVVQLSTDHIAEGHVLEAGVRIGDVYALLIGEQPCLVLTQLIVPKRLPMCCILAVVNILA